MNKHLLSIAIFVCLGLCNILTAQTFGCDGQFINAGVDQSLCEHPNGGEVTLFGSSSNNVVGFVWSDEDGEILRDNLQLEDHFISETTTFTFSGIVTSDNQVPDGEFGTGNDFSTGFSPLLQDAFSTQYILGPTQELEFDADGQPILPARGPFLLVDGYYMVTDNSINGGPGFVNCADPDGFGNIAVFHLAEEQNRIICFKVNLETGNEYTFRAEVATVGEVFFDNSGDPSAGPPNGSTPGDDPGGDIDGDGIPNGLDCCPFVTSASETDCAPCTVNGGEPDSDGDGVEDAEDNCPFVANATQDPAVCSVADTDGDGILDWMDNCPMIFNPGQEDSDGNAIGDACDEEDGGGVEEPYCIPAMDFVMYGPNGNSIVGETHQSETEFCVWSNMVRTFTADFTAEVEFCLVNACSATAGNLLALDNLQFSETCRIEDEVTVFVDNISANILPVEPLDCNTNGVLLEGEWDADFEDENSIQFFWFEESQNVLIDGATEEDYFVDEPGVYNFSVFNNETGCFAVFPMPVEDNFSTPEAIIAFPDTVSCKNQIITLDASASAGGADDGTYTYEWDDFGGDFLNGSPDPNSPLQEVISGGTYEVLVTNTFNGCTSETVVLVIENLQSVSLSTPEENFELGCDNKNFEFDVTADIDPETDLADIEYIWTLDGDTISTSNTFESPTVSESGLYLLQVINNASGCFDVLVFNVSGEAAGPEVIVPPVAENISCDNPSVEIAASLVDDTNITFAWTNSSGVNLSPNGELEINITEPGTYTFTATDNVSGCEVIEELVIDGDSEEPDFIIENSAAFDCRTSEVTLEGLLTDATGNFTFLWRDANNNSIGDSLNQVVNTAGEYRLQITNEENGCSREVLIDVADLSAEPQFDLAQDLILNCDNDIANIQINSTEANLSFVWSTTNGSIVNDTGDMISVDQDGNYEVMVTNEDNGCTSVANLDLQADFTPPTFQASQPNDLNCDNILSTLVIDDFGESYLYSWTTMNGDISSGANSPNPNFDQAGDYTVTVINPTSGCSLEQSFTVIGNSIEPELEISGGGQLGCNDQNLPITVSLLNGAPNISVAWSSNNGGAFDSQTNIANALASAAGIYDVVVTNTDNGCTATASIEVTQDNDRPEINLPQPSNLDCNNAAVVLDALGSDNDPNLQINWTAQNGSNISDPNSLNPSITQADTYTLTISNPSNGCETTASVTISENREEPTVDVVSNAELDCANPMVILGGNQSSMGSEFQYQWLDPNQMPIPGATNPTLEVSTAGNYTLNILNTSTGCENAAEVQVSGNADLPDVDAGTSVMLDCNTTSTNLSGTGPSNATYTWTTIDGSIISGANTLTPEIDASGTYTLTVLVTNTDCEASASVVVEEDTNVPEIEVAAAELLNCNNTEIVLDATQSTSTGVQILWTSFDNNAIENATSLMPTVSEPGTYVLTLIDENTNCENTFEVTVGQNIDEPVVSLEESVDLDCSDPNQFIGAPENPDFTYQWSSTTVLITASTTTAQLEVDEAGQYDLTVINTVSGCEATYTVNVTGDFEATEILALDADELTCENTTVIPNLEIDNDISEVSILWSSPSGVFIAGANTIAPEFSNSGEFNVEITNLESGCVTTSSVIVDANFTGPDFDFAGFQTIDCAQTSFTEGIPLIDQVATYQYTWTDVSGNVISNEPQYVIDSEGVFTLSIFDTANGCTSADEVEVTANFDEPEITVSADQTFRCGDTELTLQGNLISSVSNFAILWETTNGSIENGGDTFEPTISQPGTYVMVLTNLDTECTAEASVTITPDMNAPIATIDPAGDLTCAVNSLLLDGSGSTAQGNNLAFSWFRDGILIETGVDQINVDLPGIYDLVVTDVDNNCATTTSAFVDLNNTDPVVTIATPAILDCDFREVALESNFDSNMDLSFTWSDASGTTIANGPDASAVLVDESGFYTLDVLDLNTGCTVSEMVEVMQDASIPEFELSSIGDLSCNEESTNISAELPVGNFDLIWTNLSTGMEINTQDAELEITEPGSYQLEVIDAGTQCSSIRTIEIMENMEVAELDALQPFAVTCDNTGSQINAEILNGITDFSVNWTTIDGQIGSTNLNTLDLDVLSGGTYTLEVTNLESGCLSTLSVTVIENGDTPSFDFAEVDDVTCANPEVQISITNVLAIANQTISWTTPDGNIIGDSDTEQITVDADGTYIIRFENLDNGCFLEESIEVELDQDDPILNAGVAEELNCTVLESELSVDVSGASNFDVDWTTANGNISGSLTDLNTTATEEGDYTALITNLDNGCSSEITIPVTQNIDIPSISVDAAELITCRNEVVALQGTGPASLNVDVVWTDTNGGIITDAQSESVEVNLPGTYTFMVTDLDNNCINSAEVIVLENMDIPTGIVPVISEPLCFGDFGSVNIVEVEGGVGPFIYSLEGSAFDSTSDFDQLPPGVYNVSIMDSEECEYSEEIIIPETPEIIVTTSPNVELLVGQQNQINVNANIPEADIATIVWSPATFLSCDDCLNPTTTPLNDITYNITIEDENGCIATDSIAFRVQRTIGIYVPNAFSPNGDGINEAFTIFSDVDIIDRVELLAVYDRWGNEVFFNSDFPVNDEQFGWDGTFRNERLQSDVYVYRAMVILANGESQELKGDISLIR